MEKKPEKGSKKQGEKRVFDWDGRCSLKCKIRNDVLRGCVA